MRGRSPMPQCEIVAIGFDSACPNLVLSRLVSRRDLINSFDHGLHFGRVGKLRARAPTLIQPDRINLVLAGRDEKRRRTIHGEAFRSLRHADLLPVGKRDFKRECLISPTIPRLPNELRLLRNISKDDIEFIRCFSASAMLRASGQLLLGTMASLKGAFCSSAREAPTREGLWVVSGVQPGLVSARTKSSRSFVFMFPDGFANDLVILAPC